MRLQHACQCVLAESETATVHSYVVLFASKLCLVLHAHFSSFSFKQHPTSALVVAANFVTSCGLVFIYAILCVFIEALPALLHLFHVLLIHTAARSQPLLLSLFIVVIESSVLVELHDKGLCWYKSFSMFMHGQLTVSEEQWSMLQPRYLLALDVSFMTVSCKNCMQPLEQMFLSEY